MDHLIPAWRPDKKKKKRFSSSGFWGSSRPKSGNKKSDKRNKTQDLAGEQRKL